MDDLGNFGGDFTQTISGLMVTTINGTKENTRLSKRLTTLGQENIWDL